MKPWYLISIIFHITLLKINLSATSVPLVWDEQSLFNYTKANYLNGPYKKLMNHLVFDPEKIVLDKAKINSVKPTVESLLSDYSVKNFIYLVNSVEDSFSYSNFKNLILKINEYLNKNNDDFDPELLISTFISVKNSKVFIVRGDKVKKVITNNELDHLIKDIKKHLKPNKDNLHIIIKSYYENILKIYRKNIKLNKSFFQQYKNIIILFIILAIIVICVIYFSGESNDFEHKIAEKENKIISFLDKNNENSLEVIMQKYCIICLNRYYKTKDVPNSNKRKNSIDDAEVDTNKTQLQCGHIFHSKCLLKWYQKESKCPLCKSVFKLKYNHDNNNDQIEISKFTLNKNCGFSNKTKLGYIIDDFVHIQKKINPHMISHSFGNDLIKDYKINLGKDESNSNLLIYSSPENLLCKVLSAAEAKIGSNYSNKQSKYSKLDSSINITNRDMKREDTSSSEVQL